jgi:capsule polysaccharide export protein KpsE/RkpR
MPRPRPHARREEDKEHDDLTGRLGQQVVELEDQAAKHAANLSKLQTEVDMIQVELRQRKSVQLRAASDVEQTLAGLVGEHS